jgi:replicative DNA helicase
MSSSAFVAGSQLFESWREQILRGSPPRSWPLGPPFGHVEIGPGRIVLLGGPPGAGKTALIMQWVFNALQLNADLKIAVANVEMAPARLLDRQLARLSEVPLHAILRREYRPHHLAKLGGGFDSMSGLMDRIAFVEGPYDLARIADVADEFEADLLVLDYLQRFELSGKHNGLREKMNAMMSMLRQFASADVGILAAAALTRSRDSAGRSSYDGKHLGMASFRESSELEYGCDDAFLLFPLKGGEDDDHDDAIQDTMLAHVKSRDGEPKSICLKFHRRIQQFRSFDAFATPAPSVAASVNQVWKTNFTGERPDEQREDRAEQA